MAFERRRQAQLAPCIAALGIVACTAGCSGGSSTAGASEQSPPSTSASPPATPSASASPTPVHVRPKTVLGRNTRLREPMTAAQANAVIPRLRKIKDVIYLAYDRHGGGRLVLVLGPKTTYGERARIVRMIVRALAS